MVSEKHQEVIDRIGSYFNTGNVEYKNTFKKTNQLEVGMITRNDPVQVESSLNASYLTNPNQQSQNFKIDVQRYDCLWTRSNLII